MKKILLTLLAFSLWIPHALSFTKGDVETRTATASYKVSPQDRVNIQAKYTDLNVEAWDKNEVFIEATVRFDGDINDRMQQFLDSFEDEVKGNITNSTGELIIDTHLEEPNKFQVGSKHVGIMISFNEDEFKLAYKIKVPASNKLMIKNSYRNVVIRGSFEDVKIDQYSGDLEADYIEKADIKLKYGSATFREIKHADMELYEQKIKANSIETLEVNTKYSELKIKNLGETEVTSYESDFEIGTLANLEGNLKYGKMEVYERFEKGELETYEFDIEAESIGTLIYLGSKYGKLEAGSIEKLGLRQSYEDEFNLGVLGSLISEETKYGEYQIGRLTGSLELAGYEDEVTIDEIGDDATSIDIQGKYLEISINPGDRGFKLLSDTKYGKVDIDRDSMNVKTFIKDGDQLEIDATSQNTGSNPVLINIKGYEIKLDFD